MATSLALQLQKIAAASTATLDTRKLKAIHSASLLFPEEHAAAQNLDTIFCIALEGFQELCLLDDRFNIFQRSLFSESSKEVDRFLQTKEETAELNRSIEAFLQLVSGMLLLKPALKAVEWLVRRFRVHDQNTTALILAFIPYHSHPTLFPALLSIIDPKDLSQELQFLRPYLKPATAVPRNVVSHTLTRRRDFLDLLINHVTSVVRVRRDNHPLLSFFATVMTEAVSAMCDSARFTAKSGITEGEVLQKLLPLLEEAYRSKKAPEFQIGGYMLTTIIVSKVPTKDEVLLALMSGIAQGWMEESRAPALACLALIAQSRAAERAYKLPAGVIVKLLNVKNIERRLESMAKKYRVDNLVVGLSLGILEKMGKRYGQRELQCVLGLLQYTKVGPKGRKAILSKLVELAQNLQCFDEKPEEAEFARILLASQFQEWSEEPEKTKVGQTLQLVFDKNKTDVEMLELALRTVIPQPRIEAKKDINEPKAIEAPPPLTVVDLAQLTKELDGYQNVVSFLAPTQPAMLDHLQMAFVSLSQNQEDCHKLLELPFFCKEPTTARQLTFLATIWLRNSSPIIARATALSQAAMIVKASYNARIDYQALVSLVLVALSDRSERVRREAAAVIKTLQGAYKSIGEAPGSKKKFKGDSMQYWGYNDVYGTGVETEDLKWLESADAKKFLDSIIAHGLKECIIDPSFIGRLLADTLGSSKKSKKDEGRLKSTVKMSILMYLASHAVSVPRIVVKLRLLTLLNQISKAPTSRTDFLLPGLEAWVLGSIEEHQKQCNDEQVELNDVDVQFVSVVAEGEGIESLEVLVNIIGHNQGGEGLISAAAARIVAVWETLQPDVQSAVAEAMLEIRLRTEDNAGAPEAADVLTSVRLTTEAFEGLLSKAQASLKALLDPGTATAIKRRRTEPNEGSPAEKDAQLVAAVVRMTVVLELLESQGPAQHASLLKVLFLVLGNVGSANFSGMTYLQSVLLSCMRQIIDQYKDSSTTFKDTGAVRADVLVSCIRSTTSPQVQNSALLLLANLADVAPNTVKHSVMPIFTFMGANTLRQDDEYSAHVIEQTVQRVIPPLVKSLQDQDGSAVLGAAELVSTFVTSYRHIPIHRRVRLFATLTETLGPDGFLFAVLAKLAAKFNISNQDREVKVFATQLASEFSATVQIASVVKYLDTIVDVLKPEPKGLSHILFSGEEETRDLPKLEIAGRLVGVLRAVMDSDELRSKVAECLKENATEASTLRTLFTDAMENTMALGENYSQNKALSSEALALMDQILQLLSVVEFVTVIERLLSRPNSLFRSSALATFKDRIYSEYRMDTASRAAILGLSPKIGSIVNSMANNELKADALLCIQAITVKFGKHDPSTILSLAEAVVGLGALRSKDTGLRVLALVCLTQMATALSGRIIPILPKSVPVAIEYLAESAAISGKVHDLIHNAAFRYIQELVSSVPNFMTSYLPKLLPLTAASAGTEDGVDDSRDNVRGDLLACIAEKLELKAIIAAVTKAWSTTCEHGSEAIEEAIGTVQKAITHAPKATVQKNNLPLLQFFCSALDVRRVQNSDVDEESTIELEDLVMKVALEMVYKLNDTIFKPMFLRLVEWAVEDLKGSDDQGRLSRTITLWRLLETLSDSLKALVTDYYSYILDSAVEVLSAAPSDDEESLERSAWVAVLKTLRLSFSTDEREFWLSPTHFDPIFPALMSQLDSSPILSVSAVREFAIPCIVELAAATQSEEHFKTINSEVLKQMGSEEEDVRMVAVVTLKELYGRLGEEWLGLLPEALPFISELMEDDSEDVERETQRLIAKVEEYLGEGELQGMLT